MTKLVSRYARNCGILLTLLSLWGCAAVKSGASSVDGAQSSAVASAAMPDAATAPSVPPPPVGAYLAGDIALAERDVSTALTFYQSALDADPGNVELGSRVLLLAIGEGRFDIVTPLSARLLAADPSLPPMPLLFRIVEEMRDDKTAAARSDAERLSNASFFRYVVGFLRGWTVFADQHNADAAIAALLANDTDKALAQQAALHAALILDLADQPQAAEKYYQQAMTGGRLGLPMVLIVGNFYERNGNRQAARDLYDAYALQTGDTASTPHVTGLSATPPRLIANPKAGLAEGLFELASLLNQDASPDAALLLDRLALRLQPDFPVAQLVLGDVLDQEKRPEAAIQVYEAIDTASPYAWAARLRTAADLAALGRSDDSAALLRKLAAERPTQPEPLVQLANDMRTQEHYPEAIQLYTDALARVEQGQAARLWSVYFNRGIAYQHAGRPAQAEADLRKALALQPDQPEILNYLGYFLTDNRDRLAEAVTLIKRAVEISPNDGYIVDSLGWAYFRQGDYAKAETALEHAVELRAGDAEINDHLGDAYWEAGKHNAARLQWQRALSLLPEPPLAKAIQAKLENPHGIKHVSANSSHAE